MLGESIVDDRVWVIKSHYPYPMNDSGPINANKVICCARNPLDAIHSLF